MLTSKSENAFTVIKNKSYVRERRLLPRGMPQTSNLEVLEVSLRKKTKSGFCGSKRLCESLKKA